MVHNTVVITKNAPGSNKLECEHELDNETNSVTIKSCQKNPHEDALVQNEVTSKKSNLKKQ